MADRNQKGRARGILSGLRSRGKMFASYPAALARLGGAERCVCRLSGELALAALAPQNLS
jgi:hypothetical protein